MHKIKYILRDFGWVIVRYKIKMAFFKKISRLYALDRNIVWPILSKYMYKIRIGKISEHDFRKKLSKDLKKPEPTQKDKNKIFAKDIHKIFVLNTSIIAFVKRLKWLGYTSIILSDIFKPTKKIIKEIWRYDEFDKLILSCDVWLSKYDDIQNETTKIFDYALKKYKIQAQEVIFIDDVEKNCIVAQRAGIKSIVAKWPRYTIKEVKKILKI